MHNVDRYLEAATRDNTRRSYQSAIRHFEIKWGGFLLVSADSVARSWPITRCARRQHAAPASRCHCTVARLARVPESDPGTACAEVLKGIQAQHPSPQLATGVKKVYDKVVIGVSANMHGVPVGNEMGLITWAAFADADEEAIVDGEFAMREEGLQPC